jgi:hypothetical protein
MTDESHAQEWRPIETAPKDSHSRLVWCPERQNIYVVTWWIGAPYPPGWEHFGGFGGSLVETPTHWRPLPAPPTTEG